ncbi:uncharacterized protein LOC143201366 isoform X2 [Rhynchophorus ferrugineus]|uniref:uncharacterized protein LOC143201366 isoform X2 n=1 Tax=Rhynchophorus ferrugineus TaxID=354439 RepID=UPI003FCC82DE
MPAAVEDNSANGTGNSSNGKCNDGSTERSDRDQQMWKVLKAYILRDRARKKQEREAEVEEERLRKEREAREQQDVMTLGETREQISQLETKLQVFKEEKHQLFLQLKKVLNEDDNRRRQLVKETNDQMLPFATLMAGYVPQKQQALYIQQSQPPGRIQTISQQQPPPPQAAAPYKTTIKRPRSPSPPAQVPVSLYHQGYTYKNPAVGSSSYQGSPQKDDGRRNDLRAVLWNKAPQYSSQPSAFYPVAPQDISIYYPTLSREAARPVYESQRPAAFQMDHKMPEHYSVAALRTATSQHGHVIHPGTGLTINPGQATAKGGSITAGYPVRTQTQYQQAAPASLYTTQSRQMYQSYPPRE